jgi:hypothetical protein
MKMPQTRNQNDTTIVVYQNKKKDKNIQTSNRADISPKGDNKDQQKNNKQAPIPIDAYEPVNSGKKKKQASTR